MAFMYIWHMYLKVRGFFLSEINQYSVTPQRFDNKNMPCFMNTKDAKHYKYNLALFSWLNDNRLSFLLFRRRRRAVRSSNVGLFAFVLNKQ